MWLIIALAVIWGQGTRRLFDTASQDQTLVRGRWPSSSAFSSAFCFSSFSAAITISGRYFAPPASARRIMVGCRPQVPAHPEAGAAVGIATLTGASPGDYPISTSASPACLRAKASAI
jgi:hypothetical protein